MRMPHLFFWSTAAGFYSFIKPDNNTTKLTLPEQVGLVLVVGILHFALQFLTGLLHVFLHLLPLLLLHFIQRLPALGVLEFESSWTSKTGRFLSLSVDTISTIYSVLGLYDCIRTIGLWINAKCNILSPPSIDYHGLTSATSQWRLIFSSCNPWTTQPTTTAKPWGK